jgi:hypothetical protein
MGTPEGELDSKYFIEGDAHARAGDEEEFLLLMIIFLGGDATRLLSLASWIIKSVIRSGQGVVHAASSTSTVPFFPVLLFKSSARKKCCDAGHRCGE